MAAERVVPVEIIGMIGVKPDKASGSRVHVIGGGIDPEHICRFTQAHEASGFDRVLVGYASNSADGLLVTQHASQCSERIGFLVAQRPGFVAPTLAARTAATLDRLTRGRIALHIISGGNDAEQRRDGDFLSHDERYRRTDEYLGVLRRMWERDEPFDHRGEFYRVEGAFSDVKPYERASIPLYFGGASDAALAVAAKHADVYAMWGEPRAAVEAKMAEVREAAARHGRRPGFSVSFRPILGATEGEAWDRARTILEGVKASYDGTVLGQMAPRPQARGSQRLLEYAAQSDVHDERLWFPLAAATGAAGNTSALVGTAEQVAESLLAYYDLGVTTLLIRGFDPLSDAIEFGRELIPRVRAGVKERDRAPAASASPETGA